MQVENRIKRLERNVAKRPRPTASRADAVAWSHRFLAADPANPALWTEIRGWGREHNVDYIGPWREDEVHAGEYMKALYYMVTGPVTRREVTLAAGFEHAPGLLRRYAAALWGYQDATRDRFPLDLHLVDFLAPPNGQGMLEFMQWQCDLAEKLMINPDHPDLAPFRDLMKQARESAVAR